MSLFSATGYIYSIMLTLVYTITISLYIYCYSIGEYFKPQQYFGLIYIGIVYYLCILEDGNFNKVWDFHAGNSVYTLNMRKRSIFQIMHV